MEGNSPTIREAVWDWYTSVVNTRLHNDSQQIMVFTRWHEDDLIGRLEKKGKVKTIVDLADVDNIPLKHDEWFKINFEAIKTGAPTPIDPRKQGYSLWEDRHSYESLMASLELDKEKFNCLYQGNPQSQEGLMYGEFKTYFELPQMKIIKSYTDTADSGLDKLCSIVYGLPLNPADKYIYVLDVLYTDEPMEKTEPLTIQMLNRNNVNFSKVESNNGGKGFARVIQQGVTGTVTWFHQSGNKESRIFSNSASVVDRIIFPSNWYLQWGDFYNDVLNFKKLFKANKFDDCADALTGVIEEETKHTGEYDIR